MLPRPPISAAGDPPTLTPADTAGLVAIVEVPGRAAIEDIALATLHGQQRVAVMHADEGAIAEGHPGRCGKEDTGMGGEFATREGHVGAQGGIEDRAGIIPRLRLSHQPDRR
ncbi:hypothetical protein LBMAG53_12750 [Planctomycetota bacterium]|nr:hypothetical protein LBMAG53_12750 [Planctomycetota bacterium]